MLYRKVLCGMKECELVTPPRPASGHMTTWHRCGYKCRWPNHEENKNTDINKRPIFFVCKLEPCQWTVARKEMTYMSLHTCLHIIRYYDIFLWPIEVRHPAYGKCHMANNRNSSNRPSLPVLHTDNSVSVFVIANRIPDTARIWSHAAYFTTSPQRQPFGHTLMAHPHGHRPHLILAT